MIARGRRGRKSQPAVARAESEAVLAIASERVSLEAAGEAGAVHVGHQICQQLGLDKIVRSAGLSERACQLSAVMTLNRLIFPLSEHAMPDWIRNTALT